MTSAILVYGFCCTNNIIRMCRPRAVSFRSGIVKQEERVSVRESRVDTRHTSDGPDEPVVPEKNCCRQ